MINELPKTPEELAVLLYRNKLRENARKGGIARQEKMTKEQKSAFGKLLSEARKKKRVQALDEQA